MRNHLFTARRSLAQAAETLVLVLPLLLISWAAFPVHGSQAASLPGAKGRGVAKAAVTETDPWTQADLIQPEDLARLLAARKGEKPTIVYVGFPLLFSAGRIPGAVYFGEGRSAEGLASLKNWARGLRPDQPVVMYCGCCPWSECPNVRPAFKALREAGLKRLKLLYLPTGLVRDWVEKGLPFERGS
jgi:thiosulfate/3-mercaptopyruvate sulfurtransferase